MTIYFQSPLWFLMLPALFFLSIIVNKINKKYIDTDKDIHNITSVYIPSLVSDWFKSESIENKERNSLHWLLIILMTMALAQPVSKEKVNTTPNSLRDIIFIVDTSVGMSLNDYILNKEPINRLALLKAVLTEFTSNLSGNRIGVMAYADHAYTLLPLTQDRNLLTHSIGRIQPAIAGRQNNISNALSSVLRQFDFEKNTPSVVLLSQGSNIVGDISPLDAARKFKHKKIKLHVIGLGSNKNSNDDSNKLIFDSIDDQLLNDLASITSGSFHWAGKSSNLHNILSQIMQTEAIKVKKDEYYIYKNYYSYLLYTVFFIVFLTMARQALMSSSKG